MHSSSHGGQFSTPGRMGSQLAAVRALSGFTQRGLGEAAGISARQVANLEAGRSEPLLSTARRIAGALGVNLDGVFPGPDEGP